LKLRLLAAPISCLAIAVGLAACGGGGEGEGEDAQSSQAPGNNLTIYSSLPLQGTSRGQSEAVIAGERAALAKLAPGNKVGNFTIKYVSLDDSTAQNPGTADEGQTAQNARRAASDKSTIFYLGEFNSGGSKVSIPILNKAGVPQISPANTYVGLTTNDPGSEPGEPQKYYPTGKRTYARVVPRDTIQGAALVSVMKEDGCKTVTLWNDGSTYGAGLARNIALSAPKAQITVQNQQRTDKTAPNYRALAAGINSDCFMWSGVTGENGVQVFKDAAAACEDCKLYGADGVAEEAFTNPAEGGVPADVGARTKVTVATLGVKDLPASASVVNSLRQTAGTRTVDPYAIYGYETMALALDVLKAAGAQANDRAKVAELLFQQKNRQSVLGSYSIDENGDTTLTDYGLYVVKNGQPEYSKKIVADKSLIPTG
jgi:branched-chain amino acid transport system substrate-binding protein